MITTSITLEELLLARDQRREKQIELLAKDKKATLICVTIVMPGSVKLNDKAIIIGESAKREVEKAFNETAIYTLEEKKPTGYEFYLLTTQPSLETKQICCSIEQTHPLGRLFDIDVIDQNHNIISREEVGYEKRKCLLCDNEARFCMRNHTHTQDEILNHINLLVDNYLKDKEK